MLRLALALLYNVPASSMRTVEQHNSSAPSQGEPCQCELLSWDEQPEDCCAKGLMCAKTPGRGARCQRIPKHLLQQKSPPAKGAPCQCAELPWDEQPSDCCAEGLVCANIPGRGPHCKPAIQGRCRRKWLGRESIEKTECAGFDTYGVGVICGKEKRCCIPSVTEVEQDSLALALGPPKGDHVYAKYCCSGKQGKWPFRVYDNYWRDIYHYENKVVCKA
ncbi:unnamed protein product [Durusdinium trenchii]|uniref:Uncharacterized protein n=1 Tax=Durusdinium trenchii TaxID=1381693 RepID=A0ABP0P0R8_9DINO